MIKITIEGETIADISKAVIGLAGQFQAPAAYHPEKAQAPAEGKAAKPADTKKDAAPKQPAPKPAETKKELSYADDVAPKVLEMAEKKGRDATVALLATFGVAKATQLKPEQYAEVVAALDAALAED